VRYPLPSAITFAHAAGGVFVSSAQRHALQTIHGHALRKSAHETRAAADDEVGRWQKSRKATP
jgi:hypothetical protein